MAAGSGDGFSASVADLMSSLVVVFLIIAVVFMLEAKKESAKGAIISEALNDHKNRVANAKNEIRSIVLKEFDEVSENGCVRFEIPGNKNDLKLKFMASFTNKKGEKENCPYLSFAEDEFALFADVGGNRINKPQTMITINEISNVINNVLRINKSGDLQGIVKTISFQGHADSTPSIRDISCKEFSKSQTSWRHCGNLFLSSLRARSVFTEVLRKFEETGNPYTNDFLDIVDVVGRSSFEQEKQNRNSLIKMTNEDSRRVEVVFHLMEPNFE